MERFAELSRVSDPVDSAERTRRFAQLLHESHRDLFAFIYSLVQHHADAEDVYQQAALVLWNKFDEFVPGTNFAAWATTVAHLTARSFLRSKRRRGACFSDELIDSIAAAYRPPAATAGGARSEALSQCLDKLSTRDRRLVDRCYSRDRDIALIAAAENRSVAAIYQAICRIRKNLFRCIDRTLTMESR